jgi:ornithine cyclodeaminase/alanine dehydrogenase-like protein (mu-crystallin family)
MSGSILFLPATQVAAALPMEAAIAAVRDAFVQLSAGRAQVPVRTPIPLPSDGAALFMPVHLPEQGRLGVKVATVVPDNPSRGLPTIQALVAVFDATTGRTEAVMDGEVLTAVRTGAASGVATEALARADARVAAVIGAGAQGRRQLEAVCCVRRIREALVFDSDPAAAARFAEEMADSLGIPVRALHAVSEIRAADVVCTATSSNTPVLADADLAPGTHINAIGAYRPDAREIPGETVARARLVVDSRETYLHEAGDLVMALEEGLLPAGTVPAELGEVVAGKEPGRRDGEQLTLFKSVGNAVQDLAAASVVLERARRLGLGTEVQL